MSLNDHFDGLAPIALPVLYCPPNAPNDVIPALVADSYKGGIVAINTFPTNQRSGSELLNGIPHASDPRLFKDGLPTELAKRQGWWMFPKWYEDLVESDFGKGQKKSKGNS